MSLQRKLLLCGLLSLALAMATTGAVMGFFFLLYRGMQQPEPQGRQEPAQRSEANNGFFDSHSDNSYRIEAAGEPQEIFFYSYGNSSYRIEAAGAPQERTRPDGVRIGGTIAAGGLLLLLFALYFRLLCRGSFAYLKEISDGVRGFSEGRLEHKIALRGADELTQMAESLNRMAEDLTGMMERDRQAEARKNELVTSVAHDLRTPLTSILGYLGLAERDGLSEEQRRAYLATANEKARRLEKLIEDLFEYSKMTQGAIRMDCQELDLICVLRQLLEEFYPAFEQSGLTLDFYCADRQAYLSADGNLLARAFANLIGNAIKYGADGKRVELVLSQSAQEITVRITNYGEVIPREALAHIFERFYRAEGSRSSQTGGSGLGLTIAKSIVEMHGGSIDAESTLEGTVFTVQLPKKMPPYRRPEEE